MPGRNEGVQISGGRIQAGALAVGRGAVARQTSGPATSHDEVIAQRLEELLTQIDLHATHLPGGGEEVRRATQTVVNELADDHPSKLTIIGVLRSIAAVVSPVTSLFTATSELIDAVDTFL